MGFEPTRAKPINLAGWRLNHSATLSCPWETAKQKKRDKKEKKKIKKKINNNNHKKKSSHAGIWTRVLRVRAAYPNQLDYAGEHMYWFYSVIG